MLGKRWGVIGLASAAAVALALGGCSSSSATPVGATTPAGAGGAGGDGSGTGGSSSGAAGTPAARASGAAGAAGPGGAGGAGGAGGGAAGMTMDDCATLADCMAKHPDPNPQVPPTMGMSNPPDGTDNVQAVRKLYLGDTDRSDTPDPNAWGLYGFDLDHQKTTATSGFHCQPNAGGKASDIRPDGPNGVDNSFGQNIIPILQQFLMTPTDTVTGTIAKGGFTILIKIDKLGAMSDYAPLHAQLFAAKGDPATGTATPVMDSQWADGSYKWHPFAEVVNADGSSKVQFPASYMVGNTWVSGTQGSLTVELALAGQTLNLNIGAAYVATTYAADRKTTTNGNIGGVLVTQELLTTLKNVAGKLAPALCTGTALMTITQQIAAVSDIMHDGTQDPTMVCDGISIGLGFETANATLSDPAPASMGTAMGCPM